MSLLVLAIFTVMTPEDSTAAVSHTTTLDVHEDDHLAASTSLAASPDEATDIQLLSMSYQQKYAKEQAFKGMLKKKAKKTGKAVTSKDLWTSHETAHFQAPDLQRICRHYVDTQVSW